MPPSENCSNWDASQGRWLRTGAARQAVAVTKLQMSISKEGPFLFCWTENLRAQESGLKGLHSRVLFRIVSVASFGQVRQTGGDKRLLVQTPSYKSINKPPDSLDNQGLSTRNGCQHLFVLLPPLTLNRSKRRSHGPHKEFGSVHVAWITAVLDKDDGFNKERTASVFSASHTDFFSDILV